MPKKSPGGRTATAKAAMHPSPLTPYVTSILESGVDILGMLAWYTVASDCEVQHPDWIDLIDKHGAPIDKPGLPNPNHVFRRACKAAKLLKQDNPHKDTFSNFSFRDISNDADFIHKAIVEEIVDRGNLVLDHRTIAKVSMTKATQGIDFDCRIEETDYAHSSYVAMENIVEGFIQDKAKVLHDMPIREAARRGIENTLDGVRVRPSGGVYFVTLDNAISLEAIANVINEVEGARFDILPLVDDPKQRDMLANAVQDEAVGATQELINQMKDLLSSGEGVPVKTFMEIATKFGDIKARVVEYTNLLDHNLALSQAAIMIAEEQINTIIDRTEIKGV